MILFLLYLVAFSFIIWRSGWFSLAGIPRWFVLGGFWLKLLAGIAFWAVYSFHYGVDHGSDAFAYFDEGQILHRVFYESPVDFFRLLFATNPSDPTLQEYIAPMDRWNRAVNYGVLNDNPTIIKFNALVMFFSRGFIHTHTLFMAFVSFSGLVLWYRFFIIWLTKTPRMFLFAALLLPPSLLFWGSGVMKEGLLIFGLGLLFFGMAKLKNKNFTGIIWMLLAGPLLLFTKAYVLIAFAPAILFLGLMISGNTRHQLVKFAGLHAALFAFVLSLGLWVEDYNVFHMFQLKQKDFYNVSETQHASSTVAIPPLNHWTDMILNAPTAIFNTYFRPHLLEANSLTFVVSALENLFYLLLIAATIIRFKRPRGDMATMALFCVSCLIGLGLLVGLVTPVLGALVRYKIPALPFLVVLCGIVMHPSLASLSLRLQTIIQPKQKKP
ncbi:MAG: hypothetical protein EA392_08505 [Cryomorphaceae bacterium]|nr:MAG: hypothetical protein EA392_08505 [Cryomorphaceae bacterium]